MKTFHVIESYTTAHHYEVDADSREEAESKLQDFLWNGDYENDIEHLVSLDDSDMYDISCEEEI